MYWEELRKRPEETPFRYAVLDFDGTVSLIREGWQPIMIRYFTEELARTPQGKRENAGKLTEQAREMIFFHTGKQTIYQCIALAEAVTRMGGVPQPPQAYKDEYLRRLMRKIDGRLKGLQSGAVDPETLTVPGTYALLGLLERHGVTPYLASGTDEEHVLREAELLGLTRYFGSHIYGAQRDYKTFSKRMVIQRLIRENNLAGEALLGFGDGYVEIGNIREVGGYAVGVASDEARRQGVDAWKRERLLRAGADAIIPDFRQTDELEGRLFGATKGESHAVSGI